jgi:hypothetical protein
MITDDIEGFRKWYEEERQADLSTDEFTLKRVVHNLEGLKHVNYCFLLDARKHNPSHVQHLEGIQEGFKFCIKEIERLINKEPS